MAMELMPNDFSFEDDLDNEEGVQELDTVHRKVTQEEQTTPLQGAELERLADLLSQQTYLAVSSDLHHRRDWAALRTWKAMVTREQLPLIEQLLAYPLFAQYARFLLGRPSAPFLEFLQSRPPTRGDVDEAARWQSLRFILTSTREMTEEVSGDSFMSYNIICEVKADESYDEGQDESRSRTWAVCKRFREFRKLYNTLRPLHKTLSKLHFPSRTFVKSETNQKVVAQRREALDAYLQGVLAWIHAESPWQRGDTVTREWMAVTETLGEFLALPEMAVHYPKVQSQKRVDCDLSLHPTLQSEDWLRSISDNDATELYLSQAPMSLQALAFLLEGGDMLKADIMGLHSPPEECAAFLQALSQCQSLQRLYLSHVHTGTGLVSEDVVNSLLTLLREASQLEVLLLSGWELGPSLQQVATQLASTQLRVLDLSASGITDIQTGMLELCSALRSTSLRELYLDENSFGDDGAKLLAVALRQNPALETLSAKYCKITPFGMMKILDALDRSTAAESSSEVGGSNSNLLRLYLVDMSREGEDDDAVRTLAVRCGSMLEHNSALQVLDLSGHYFDTDDGLIIMRALQHNHTLRRLLLSYSKRNWQSAQIFLEFFHSHQSVRTLHLRHPMAALAHADEEERLDHLRYAVPNDETLRELFVWNMAPPVFSLLCQSLGSNTSLLLLDCQATLLEESLVDPLETLLRTNTTLRELLLRTDPDAELGRLFQALVSSHLTALTLSNLTREQGDIFVRCLQAERPLMLERVALRFADGAVPCDVWERVHSCLQQDQVAVPSSNGSYLFT